MKCTMTFRIESHWANRYVEATTMDRAIVKHRQQSLKEWRDLEGKKRSQPPTRTVVEDIEPTEVVLVSRESVLR